MGLTGKEAKAQERERELNMYLQDVLGDPDLNRSEEIFSFLELHGAIAMGTQVVELSAGITGQDVVDKTRNVLSAMPGILQVRIDIDRKYVMLRGLKSPSEMMNDFLKVGVKTELWNKSEL
eukprot:TRINITY_DN473_c0_g1_i1.p1 TRINITY_DN473_c0_g1~~TRINITY_DN473_c0_g1_i1.p1  ORF type:complete len:121 (-),score=31.00 TRINITY_DN473_c0_g1_i1:38-400(-)